MEKLITRKEAAEILGISIATLDAARNNGLISYVQYVQNGCVQMCIRDRWYFKNEMNNGSIEEFDGISLVEWTEDNKIKSLKEFGCNRNTYNPYQEGDTPQFKAEKANWF